MSALKTAAKWIVGIVLALAAVLVLGGYAISPKFTVERSVVVAAPAAKVYALVDDPRRWNDWAIWNRRDPAMAITYSGPPRGAGAVWSWKSKTQGDGTMTFTGAEADKRLGYDLFFPDFGTTSRGELLFAAEGEGTRVRWIMHGDMGSNPLFRWMALMADGMVGQDFEAGLAGLKALAEK
jgi:uncharacterized protein YndB with AHSA1/START domain